MLDPGEPDVLKAVALETVHALTQDCLFVGWRVHPVQLFAGSGVFISVCGRKRRDARSLDQGASVVVKVGAGSTSNKGDRQIRSGAGRRLLVALAVSAPGGAPFRATNGCAIVLYSVGGSHAFTSGLGAGRLDDTEDWEKGHNKIVIRPHLFLLHYDTRRPSPTGHGA